MARSAKAFAATYFLASCLLMLVGTLVPGNSGPVAVFAKPWGDTAIEVVANAGGPIIFVQNASWVALTEATDPGFVEKLYRSGAGFVASSAVAQVCARFGGVSLEKDI